MLRRVYADSVSPLAVAYGPRFWTRRCYFAEAERRAGCQCLATPPAHAECSSPPRCSRCASLPARARLPTRRPAPPARAAPAHSLPRRQVPRQLSRTPPLAAPPPRSRPRVGRVRRPRSQLQDLLRARLQAPPLAHPRPRRTAVQLARAQRARADQRPRPQRLAPQPARRVRVQPVAAARARRPSRSHAPAKACQGA